MIKSWYERNKELTKKRAKLWKKNNPEKLKQNAKKYRKIHKKQRTKNQQEWNKKNSKRRNEYTRRWARNNHKKIREKDRKWYNTPAGKASTLKRTHKRKRELGFLPLNAPFPDSQGHHINKTVVIYIPTELHRSVPHNVFKGGEGLDKINHLAFEWLKKQTKEPETQGGAF